MIRESGAILAQAMHPVARQVIGLSLLWTLLARGFVFSNSATVRRIARDGA